MSLQRDLHSGKVTIKPTIDSEAKLDIVGTNDPLGKYKTEQAQFEMLKLIKVMRDETTPRERLRWAGGRYLKLRFGARFQLFDDDIEQIVQEIKEKPEISLMNL